MIAVVATLNDGGVTVRADRGYKDGGSEDVIILKISSYDAPSSSVSFTPDEFREFVRLLGIAT